MFKRKAARIKNSTGGRVEEDEQVENGGEDENENENGFSGCFLPFVAYSPLKVEP